MLENLLVFLLDNKNISSDYEIAFILDYERVLKAYGDLYDFIELKRGGIINRNEYLKEISNWGEIYIYKGDGS